MYQNLSNKLYHAGHWVCRTHIAHAHARQTYSIILHVNWIWVNAWIVLATKSCFIIYEWCSSKFTENLVDAVCERTEHITYPQARLVKGNRIWVPSSKSKANVYMLETHIGWRSQTWFAYRFKKFYLPNAVLIFQILQILRRHKHNNTRKIFYFTEKIECRLPMHNFRSHSNPQSSCFDFMISSFFLIFQ